MPKDDAVTATPAPRWMRLLLAASLALNLLVLGAVAGIALRGGPQPMAVRDLGFGPFAAALSPEDRTALRRAFLTRAMADGDGRRTMREDMRALLAVLRADPFDAAALRDILERGAARTAERLDLGLSLIEERVVALPQAERLAFADRLEQVLRRGPRHREAQGDDPPGP